MQGLKTKSKVRIVTVFTALIMLLNTFGGGAAIAAPALSVSVQASPSIVESGASTSLEVNIHSSETKDLLVDIEIFDSSFKKVYQAFTDNIRVEAGNVRSVPFTWDVPAGLPPGTYVISLGVFGAGWNGMYEWYAGIGNVQVAEGMPQTGVPAPRNLKAVPSNTSIKLTWDSVAEAGAYDVEADGDLIESVSVPSYEHIELDPNTEHFYRVRARNGDSVGEWSAGIPSKTTFTPSNGSKLKINFKSGESSTTQMPTPEFEIYNSGSEPINLAEVKARYYFTIDGEMPLSIGYWTTVTKSYVNLQFVKMPIPSEQADYYLEVSFTPEAGILQPGAKVGVYSWMNKSDWSSFNQSNDYSYLATSSSLENENVTGYLSGTLDWGNEPILLDIPSSPDSIIGTPTDSTINVAWNPIEGATGYDIEADGTIVENLNNPSYLDEWLNPGTRHTYKVRTRKGANLSIWSSPVTVRTTGEQNLPAPVNFRGNTTENSIALSWGSLEESVTGYEIEVDGEVIDTGASTFYVHSELAAGTRHTYRVRAKDDTTRGKWSLPLTTNTIFTPTSTFDVQFHVDTLSDRAPISPYIYGTNDDLTGTENWSSRRMGGNRMSTYNWENNASNAGADYFHNSDNYIPWYYGGVPWGGNMDEPGVGVAGFHNQSLAKGAYTLATLQTAGYAANDKNGAVSQAESAPSSRWVPVIAAKNAPFSLVPDLNDNAVYMDEFVNLMVSQFGNASTPTGIKGYSIDNEPSLWQHTHPFMHPTKPGAAEVLTKGIELAKAVKKVDPYAELFGPAAYSFDELYSMHAADDWNSIKGSYSWYMDYYLDKFRVASAHENTRLLDAVDFHWYPEVTAGGHRITDSASYDNLEANLVRMQATRSLWDPTYTEDSWIGQWYSAFLPILPRTQQSIDQYNPGTKIAITEYNYGGEDNVYGGIAQADVLGIFGKYGVHFATFWKMVNHLEDAPYISAAVKLFTNYDGNNSGFGDTKVKAETSNIENSSIYASVNKDNEDELHLIVINKNNDYDMNAMLNISGGSEFTSARVFAFDEGSSDITERPGISEITGDTLTYTVPKLTAVHIILSK